MISGRRCGQSLDSSCQTEGAPEQRRALPAEQFTCHSFHKYLLNTHCMPSTGQEFIHLHGQRQVLCLFRKPCGEDGVFDARGPSKEGPWNQHSLLRRPLRRAKVSGHMRRNVVRWSCFCGLGGRKSPGQVTPAWGVRRDDQSLGQPTLTPTPWARSTFQRRVTGKKTQPLTKSFA